MVYICLDCYEVFDEEIMKNAKKTHYECSDVVNCPKTKCLGSVVEIDELMFPIIKILNKKGYYTRYCCSGHIYHISTTTYIKFQEGVKLPNLPNDFKADKDNFRDGLTIRKDYIQYQEDEVKLYEEILKSSLVLMAWANKLPSMIK